MSVAGQIARYLESSLPKPLPVEEIQRRLDLCQGCADFTGDNCRRMATCCAYERRWFNGLMGFGAKPKSCPAGKWG